MWCFYLFVLFVSVSADTYTIRVSTSDIRYAGTGNPVYILMEGNRGILDEFQLINPTNQADNTFRRARTNVYVTDTLDIGIVCSLRIRLGGGDGWHITEVLVKKKENRRWSLFEFNRWIDDDAGFSLIATETLKVDGGWSCWGSWSECAAECNEKENISRHRLCDNPSPGCGGDFCSGESTEHKTCFGLVCTTTSTTTTETSMLTSTDYESTNCDTRSESIQTHVKAKHYGTEHVSDVNSLTSRTEVAAGLDVQYVAIIAVGLLVVAGIMFAVGCILGGRKTFGKCCRGDKKEEAVYMDPVVTPERTYQHIVEPDEYPYSDGTGVETSGNYQQASEVKEKREHNYTNLQATPGKSCCQNFRPMQ